jgi:ParB family chromosome partitioning protein
MKLARVAPQLLKEYRSDGITLECLMAYTLTDDHRRQLKVFKSLPDWHKTDPSAIRAALTEKMVDADSKLARFVGLDAYTAAGGPTRADLFGTEVYLEKPELLTRLAGEKLEAIRKELEAEGWGWIEINPEREWEFIGKCSRLHPRLTDAPADLLSRREAIKAEIENLREALDHLDADSDERVEAAFDDAEQRLEQVEEQLSAYVGFEAEQKPLAGCYVSISQDGTPFLDKGLVKPEHRKQLDRLLATGENEGEPASPKVKNPFSETLRRDLAAFRLQAARVELARHPAIAFDLLVFKAASHLLDQPRSFDGPDIEFRLPKPGKPEEATAAAAEFAAIAKSLAAGWRKPKSEEARFQAFRSLPEEDKLELLAYCVALTLKPKLAPAAGDEVTAYDAALAMTEANVAAYWRPGKDSFLSRVSRDQLLAVARDTLGDAWAFSRARDKKALLVEQLDRAFADPAKYGRTPEQQDQLKNWLPAGMAFGTLPAAKPEKGRKVKKAA